MKKNRLASLFVVMILLLTIILPSCSKKITFNASTIVPAAEGRVKIKKDKNLNYSIEVSTVHLAEPDKLAPPKKVYVVWIETEQNGVKNIGQLKTSGGLLSKALKASLQSVSSFKPVRLFVTAEEDANVSYWQGPTVLTTGSIQ